uniref:Uncharacterized protein n=1 Tax=Ixodes scapularis TaxID=6945 RepID=A0A4D5RF25_IXOSC
MTCCHLPFACVIFLFEQPIWKTIALPRISNFQSWWPFHFCCIVQCSLFFFSFSFYLHCITLQVYKHTRKLFMATTRNK